MAEFATTVFARKLAGSLAVLACATTLHAQPIKMRLYVDRDAPTGGDGFSWASAFNDLQDAFEVRREAILADVEIRIAEGRYTPDRGTMDTGSSFEIETVPTYSANSALTLSIRGGFAGLGHADPDERDPSRFVTVLSGDLAGDDGPDFANREDNCEHVIFAPNGPQVRVELDGLVIEGGNAREGNGGGICVNVPRFQDGSVSLTDCIVRDNLASSGGGIFVCPAADLFASHGGLLVSGGMVSGNRATRDGGGIYCDDAKLHATQIVDNEAAYGGGFAGGGYEPSVGRLEFDRVLVAGNRATIAGGGIYTRWIRGYRLTLAQNRAPLGSGALAEYWIDISFSIVAGNAGAPRAVETGEWKNYLKSSCVVGGLAQLGPEAPEVRGFLIEKDPRFVDPVGLDRDPMRASDNDYRLLADSPCIDIVGCGSRLFGLPLIDPLGSYACVDVTVFECDRGLLIMDLGAFEYQPQHDCGDFNRDGVRNSQDILEYLDAYAARLSTADLVRPCGTPRSEDFAEMLRRFEEGCP
ncbi:MAG: hypothetical protein RBS39_05820 [Phycisphaerales bacterium]|jgi:predicted outer membrane repeat protein|nr:hypothetical protein [Phycisphaerales bacterium]